MTKTLEQMTIEELREGVFQLVEDNDYLRGDVMWFTDELARRLAELEREVKRQSDGWEEAINIYNMWIERATKAEAEIERMKPVVEVALLIYHNPTGVWLGRLFEACRKYEEGK